MGGTGPIMQALGVVKGRVGKGAVGSVLGVVGAALLLGGQVPLPLVTVGEEAGGAAVWGLGALSLSASPPAGPDLYSASFLAASASVVAPSPAPEMAAAEAPSAALTTPLPLVPQLLPVAHSGEQLPGVAAASQQPTPSVAAPLVLQLVQSGEQASGLVLAHSTPATQPIPSETAPAPPDAPLPPSSAAPPHPEELPAVTMQSGPGGAAEAPAASTLPIGAPLAASTPHTEVSWAEGLLSARVTDSLPACVTEPLPGVGLPSSVEAEAVFLKTVGAQEPPPTTSGTLGLAPGSQPPSSSTVEGLGSGAGLQVVGAGPVAETPLAPAPEEDTPMVGVGALPSVFCLCSCHFPFSVSI